MAQCTNSACRGLQETARQSSGLRDLRAGSQHLQARRRLLAHPLRHRCPHPADSHRQPVKTTPHMPRRGRQQAPLEERSAPKKPSSACRAWPNAKAAELAAGSGYSLLWRAPRHGPDREESPAGCVCGWSTVLGRHGRSKDIDCYGRWYASLVTRFGAACACLRQHEGAAGGVGQ